MPTTVGRRALPVPIEADGPDVPRDITNLATAIQNLAVYNRGTLAAMPSTGNFVGDFYRAYDDLQDGPNGTLYEWTGSAWAKTNQSGASSWTGSLSLKGATGAFNFDDQASPGTTWSLYAAGGASSSARLKKGATDVLTVDGNGLLSVNALSCVTVNANPINAVGTNPYIRISKTNGTVRNYYLQSGQGASFDEFMLGESANASFMRIGPSNAGGTVDRMSVSQAGDVSTIGNTNIFSVRRNDDSGSVIWANLHAGTNTHSCYLASVDQTDNSAYNYVFCANSTGNRAWIRGDGQFFSSDGVIHGISDVRLKENVQTLVGGLEVVKKLRPVEFDWNSESLNEGHSFGFISQEAEKIVPHLVDESHPLRAEPGSDEWEDAERYKTFAAAGLIPHLVGAIQELTARVEQLETQLAKS